MLKEMLEININGLSYFYNKNKEYIKDGHSYCILCNSRKDGDVIEILGQKFIFKVKCNCDVESDLKEKKRDREIKVKNLKRECFYSTKEWNHTFSNYQGEKERAFTVARSYCENFEIMLKDNIGLLFFGSVGSGKTYLASAIANELIESKFIAVKMRNFCEIINDLQKGFEIDKNTYIKDLVTTPLLILDDLGIERDTEYAKEQVYNVINSRYLENKTTIFTTNIPLESIKNPIDLSYKRIYSRILEMTIPVMVIGDDFRELIHKEKLDLYKNILGGGNSNDKRGSIG